MTDSNVDRSMASFSEMLRVALGDQLAPTATTFVEMVAEDVVMEFPYAPQGSVRRLEGRAAVRAHLAAFSGVLEIARMTDLVVHRTLDPSVVILQFGCVGRAVKSGGPYDQTYISVITLRDGHIARYLDYWNPLVVLEALGGKDALVSSFGGGR